MRTDRRLAARFGELHRPTRTSVVEDVKATESILTVLVRVVSVIGDWALRTGLLSDRTKNDLEATLRGAGRSGTASLRQFVGAKVLLLVALPLGAWLISGTLGFEMFTRLIATAAGAIGGLVVPDMVGTQACVIALPSGSRMNFQMRST